MTLATYRKLAMALALGTTLGTACGQTYTFTTLPKKSAQGLTDSSVAAARFRDFLDLAVDRHGNLYMAERFRHTVRKITSTGRILTLAGEPGEAGSADGSGPAARFSQLTSIVVDGTGNLYVTDNSTVRKITPDGVVTTLAGSPGQRGLVDAQGSDARFDFRIPRPAYGPSEPEFAGLAVDDADNVFLADMGNRRIRRISPEGVVTTFAESPQFLEVHRLAFDRNGNLFVIDPGHMGAIYRISPSGAVTATSLQPPWRNPPHALAFDDDGNIYLSRGDGAVWDYYWSDYPAGHIEKITPTGERSVWAGSALSSGEDDGLGRAARFGWSALGMTSDPHGNLYVADLTNNLVRKITRDSTVMTLASIAPDAASTSSDARVVNVSVRAALRAAQPLVVTLDVEGSRSFLLRAIGPGLRPFLPAAALADDPRIELHASTGASLNSNDNWGGGVTLREAFVGMGAFALESDSRDAALLHTLEGQSTVHVTSSTNGVALFESYQTAPQPTSRATKYRVRHRIGTGADEPLVAGFTLSGSETKTVLLRGLGPGLASSVGVNDALARTMLRVFGPDGQLLADNDAWPATLAAQFARAGASPLESGSRDAALSLALSPGGYVVVLRGTGGATGEGMLEIYDFP